MVTREDFLNYMPKPSVSEIFVYNPMFVNVVGVDVFDEYRKLYKDFVVKKKRYLELKKEIEIYSKSLDNSGLYNNKWDEKDYIECIQRDKKVYNNLFKDVNKIETSMAVLDKKIHTIDEKIEMQKIKDKEEIDINLKENEENINRLKVKISNYKENINNFKQEINAIDEMIKDNEEDFEVLIEFNNSLKVNNAFNCPYCGAKHNKVNENSRLFLKLRKNLEKNKSNMEKLVEKKSILEKEVLEKTKVLNLCIENYNNSLSFKKDNENIVVRKKSIPILRLESSKKQMLLEKDILNDKLELFRKNGTLSSDKYKTLKHRIERCEFSLTILKELKDGKTENTLRNEEFEKLKTDLKMLIKTLDIYKEYIKVYFNIIEQKAISYCTNEFRFELFNFEDYKLNYLFNIYYNGTELSKLDKEQRDKCDKYLSIKFQTFE